MALPEDVAVLERAGRGVAAHLAATPPGEAAGADAEPVLGAAVRGAREERQPGTVGAFDVHGEVVHLQDEASASSRRNRLNSSNMSRTSNSWLPSWTFMDACICRASVYADCAYDGDE
ncbi:hypothetical protein ACFPRL_32000 [Pseudoclavibacter helvolus]